MPTDSILGSTATTFSISPNVNVTSAIDFSGDQDWFRINLIGGVAYQFSLAGADGYLDTYLRLLDSGGGQLAVDDDSGGNLSSLITYTAPNTGTYYLSAQAYAAGTGAYDLRASVVDDYAATTATTGQVTVNGTAASGIVEVADDSDWFRIDLAAGTRYQFRLDRTASGGLTDPYLRLLTSGGTQVAADDDSGGNANALINYTTTAAGTYYLAAEDWGSGTGAYRLSATIDDDYAGSTATTGRVGTGGTPVSGQVETTGDQDWFRVALTAGTTYNFRLESAASDGIGDPVLRLLNGTGAELVVSDDDGAGLNSFISYTAPTTGNYYLSAQGYSSLVGTYVLSASILDDYAGDTATTASLNVNATPATGRVDTTSDQDWFRLDLNAGTAYQFRLNSTTSGGLGDPYLRLLNSGGTELTVNDDGGGGVNSLITYTPTSSGTYFLSAQGLGTTTGGYLLSATTVDDYAATTATTGRVTANGAASSGRIENPGDQDWLRVTLTAGVAYDLRLNRTATDGLPDPYLRLLSSAGTELAHNDDSGGSLNSLITFTPTTTGNYYLAAQNLWSGGTGSYQVSATAVDDYAGTTATTGTVAVNGTRSTGRIEVASDQDWFRVDLVANTAYQFRLNTAATGGLADPYLRLLNSAGSQLAANDDGGGGVNSLITYTPSTSGAYYLSARDYGTGTGAYNLAATTVRVNALPRLTGSAATLPNGTEDQVYRLTNAQLLQGWTDSDGPAPLAVANLTANHGTLAATTAGWTFTPETNYTGVVSLNYGVSDGAGQSAATRSFRLNAVAEPAGVTVTPTAGTTTNEGGGAASFSVRLDKVPTRNVVIAFSSSDTTEGRVSAGTLTFTAANWNVAQTLRIIGGQDYLNDGTVSYAVNAAITTDDVEYADYARRGGIAALRLTNAPDVTHDVPHYLNGIDRDVTQILRPGAGTSNDNDTDIAGLDGPDRIWGGYGMDDLSGGIGDDQLRGEQDDDILYGEDGNDKLYGGDSDDRLFGGAGNDQLYGQEDDDRLEGGPGNDILDGGYGTDTLIGGPGNDTYYLGFDANDIIDDQGLATDVDTVIMPYQLTSYTLPANIENGTLAAGTTAGTLIGNTGNNRLTGNNGTNTLNGGGGNDTLNAGAGNDRCDGGIGNDALDGGTGNDVIIGGAGNDTVTGGDGNDTLIDGAGNDNIQGGTGTDTLSYAGTTTAVVINLSNGTATGSGTDTLIGVESAIGGNANDRLTGSGTANQLDGGNGNDVVSGGSGNDTLIGGNGNDTLLGGAGADRCTGGAGADNFKFVTRAEGPDTLTDFTSGTDHIQVVSANFGGLTVGALAPSRFVKAGTALTSSAAVFIYNDSTGTLSFDANGNGAGGLTQIATLAGNRSLVASDIQIVATS